MPVDELQAAAKSALRHGDRTPKNALPDIAGGLGLVDWNEAAGVFRVRDYAGLTYCYSYTRKDGAAPA